MTARDELLDTGRIGREGAALLYRTVRLVASGYGFPPPRGSQTWDESAAIETAHDFLEGERGARRLREITIRSVDDRSFEHLLDAAVHNFLRDLSRRTDLGKLILRMKEILRDEGDFAEVPEKPDRWMLTGGKSQESTVPPGDLTAAIAGMSIAVPRWSSDRRDAPLADRPSFVRLIVRVLATADGSLATVDLAHAIASRLDHRRTPLATIVDIDDYESEPALQNADSSTSAVANLQAEVIFRTLSDREKVILADPDASVRDLGRKLDIGKSQVALVRQRLFDKLRDVVDADDEDVVVRLCDLCGGWIRHWTARTGATSDG